MSLKRKCAFPDASLFIGRREETEKLYRAEAKLSEVFHLAVQALRPVLGHTEAQHWDDTMAAALLGFLQGQQREAVVAACVSFLRSYGLEVSSVNKGLPVSHNLNRHVVLTDDGVEVYYAERLKPETGREEAKNPAPGA